MGAAPALVTRPEDGLPLDYVPGEDLLVATAKGSTTTVLPTEAQAETAPHLTPALRPSDGVFGRLLEGGRPIVGARVELTSVSLHLAEPRESLGAARTLRHPTERQDSKALTGLGGHSPESVLGLDGAPPAYRLVTTGVQHAGFTDGKGRFHLRDVKRPSVGLLVHLEGRPTRCLGTYTLANGTLDLGNLEVSATASLSGRFNSAWPWEPTRCVLVLRDPRREVPIDRDNGFSVEGLEPGSVYFTLAAAGQEACA